MEWSNRMDMFTDLYWGPPRSELFTEPRDVWFDWYLPLIFLGVLFLMAFAILYIQLKKSEEQYIQNLDEVTGSNRP